MIRIRLLFLLFLIPFFQCRKKDEPLNTPILHYADGSMTNARFCADGNFLILKVMNSDTLKLLKMNPYGQLLSTQTSKLGLYGYTTGIAETRAGFVFTGGVYQMPPNSGRHLIVSKLTNSGEIIWKKDYSTFKDDIMGSIVALSDGNLLLASQYFDPESNFMLTKIDEDGNIIWQKNWDGVLYEQRHVILENADGEIYAVTYSLHTSEMRILKFSAAGTLIWITYYPKKEAFDMYRASGAMLDKEGNLLVCGVHFIAQKTDAQAYLAKINPNGKVLWEKDLGSSTQNEEASNLDQNEDGTIVITGTSNGPNSSGIDVLILRTDKDGNMLSYTAFGKSPMDYGVKVQALPGGDFAVLGNSGEAFGNFPEKIFLTRMDSKGKFH